MYKGYKVQIYPNKEQALLLDKHFGCARWVYNKMIEINEKKYKRTGNGMSGYTMASYLPKLKKQHPWLKEVNASAMQIVCHNLADAYNRFFKKLGNYPNFKKKDGTRSFTCFNGSEILDKHIKLPKLGLIRYRGGQAPIGKVSKFTASECAGKYYVSILIETPEREMELREPTNILGIDIGLNNFIVTSHGFEIPAAKYTRKYQSALRRKQQALARRKKGSKRRAIAKLEVARLHQKISNKRKDHAHKLSEILVSNTENQSFAIENLNIKGMMANHKLAKSIADAGWYQFLTFLKYKATAVGKPVLEVGRFYPSSKTCSACGVVKESLALSEREWVCGSCGAKHNRDINAAINIALEAARNAVRGDNVIPFVRRVAIGEARNLERDIPTLAGISNKAIEG